MDYIFFADIPYFLRFIFMILQSLAVFLFIFYFSEIRFTIKLLVSISAVKTLLKNWYQTSFEIDFISVVFLNLLVNIFLVYAFTKVFNYKVVITATLTSLVLLITIPTVTLYIVHNYPSIQAHVAWFIARLPQSIILALIVLWAHRTKFLRESTL